MAQIHARGGFGFALRAVTVPPLLALVLVRRLAPRRQAAALSLFVQGGGTGG